MESIRETEKLYTTQEFADILKKFNILYIILKNKFSYIFNQKFWLDDNEHIKNVQRWIIQWEESIFWDYLWATHNTMQNILWISKQKNEHTVYRCIRLVFWWWKNLILCTNSTPQKSPNGTICLDEYYMKLNNFERNTFDDLLRYIGKIEYEHFHSDYYWSEINKLKNISKDNLFEILNIKKYNK